MPRLNVMWMANFWGLKQMNLRTPSTFPKFHRLHVHFQHPRLCLGALANASSQLNKIKSIVYRSSVASKCVRFLSVVAISSKTRQVMTGQQFIFFKKGPNMALRKVNSPQCFRGFSVVWGGGSRDSLLDGVSQIMGFLRSKKKSCPRTTKPQWLHRTCSTAPG